MVESLLCATCNGHGITGEGHTCTDCSGVGMTTT